MWLLMLCFVALGLGLSGMAERTARRSAAGLAVLLVLFEAVKQGLVL